MKSKASSTLHACPVCGFNELREAPRGRSGGASFEICPACGFQFGVSDDDDGIGYEEWRADWVERGMVWCSKGIPCPKGWDPRKLLKKMMGGSQA